MTEQTPESEATPLSLDERLALLNAMFNLGPDQMFPTLRRKS